MAHPTIKIGARGSAVRTAQRRLKARYYDPGPVDGRFGAKTERAVKYYQLDRELTADGIIGPERGRGWTRRRSSAARRAKQSRSCKRCSSATSTTSWDPGAVDGNFGATTERAVKNFQDEMNLEDDGIVGPETWAMLGS